MRLNTGFVFCALVCFSTILHPVCGSPLPSSNGMRTPSLTSDSGSESESNSQLHTLSESHRTLRLESFVAGEIPVRIELDFLESCVIEGLKPFASTKLGIAHPIIDTHNFAQREQPFPLSTKPLDDGQQVLTYMCIFTPSPNLSFTFVGVVIVQIVYDVHRSAPSADRSTTRMFIYIVRPRSHPPNPYELARQLPQGDTDALQIGPGYDLRFTNPVPFDHLKVGPVRRIAAPATNNGGAHHH
ncbi:hypothetical protein C8R42DRAFT_775847 [Lentinula raphanica]|nr:hypothetical protein C8R42DRAFT_775847 [Lentinula raphanica]